MHLSSQRVTICKNNCRNFISIIHKYDPALSAKFTNPRFTVHVQGTLITVVEENVIMHKSTSYALTFFFNSFINKLMAAPITIIFAPSIAAEVSITSAYVFQVLSDAEFGILTSITFNLCLLLKFTSWSISTSQQYYYIFCSKQHIANIAIRYNV